ncbi:MAG TPA: hypothetical protein VKZ63_02005, partial [Kofleriaceae bacterium]|nr:hypothetical protein [Kofleriaceae bacterium]
GGAAVGGGGIAPGEGARGGGIHIGTWIAGGVAVAALAGGVGFGLAARSAESDLEKDGCGTRVTCDEGRIDSLETRMLAADVLYGVAAVSAAAAVVIQWRLGGADEPAPPPVAVTAGPRSIGLAVGGRF